VDLARPGSIRDARRGDRVLEQFWIEIPHGTERENFSVTDAPFAAALLLVRRAC